MADASPFSGSNYGVANLFISQKQTTFGLQSLFWRMATILKSKFRKTGEVFTTTQGLPYRTETSDADKDLQIM